MARELAVIHPDAHCELDFTNAFELLVATVLSAQTTDKMVNKVTPTLFAQYPDAVALAGADREELETILKPTGFFRAKANSVLGLSQALVERFDGEVPGRMADLVTLPGVGRKTANVVLGNAFGVPGLTVDTHFGRLVRRFGWTAEEDPVKVEAEIAELVPKKEWTDFSHRVIFHGRRVCHAKKAACGACGLAPWCPSFGIGPVGPRGRPEAGQVARRLGHRVMRRRAIASSVGSAALAGRLHVADRTTRPRRRRPSPRRLGAGRAPSSPTSRRRGAAAARPGVRLPRWRDRSTSPGLRGAHRGQPLGQLVRALPGGAAADPGVRRRRRRPGPRRRASSARTACRRPESFAADAGVTFPSAFDGEGELMAELGPQRAALHVLPRRRRRARPHRGRAGRLGRRAARAWSPSTSGCSCERDLPTACPSTWCGCSTPPSTCRCGTACRRRPRPPGAPPC